MNDASASELFQRVRTLELVARRNAAGRLQGDYVSSFKGGGLLFEEPRRYVPGDPVRSIDWNITARVQEPHVRVHREERQRDVMLAIDVSPSMHTGFHERTKLETAVELAATLAVSAAVAGDRLGYVSFADVVLERSRPRGGRAQLWRVLRGLLDQTAPWSRPVSGSDPRVAIHELESLRGGSMVVFLISDFFDRDVPDDLRYLRPRHDVSLLHVYDPFEVAETRHLAVPGIAPEGESGPGVVKPEGVATSSAAASLAAACALRGIGLASFATDRPVGPGLAELFHEKRRSRRR
jgi:uncharacterized protein (DUF58 family)